jgi:dihydrofolate reductase
VCTKRFLEMPRCFSLCSLRKADLEELDQTDLMQESIRTTGAVVMGRRTFEMASDPDSYAATYEFQVPIVVITEQAPERKPKENGRISFTFVDNVDAEVSRQQPDLLRF